MSKLVAFPLAIACFLAAGASQAREEGFHIRGTIGSGYLSVAADSAPGELDYTLTGAGLGGDVAVGWAVVPGMIFGVNAIYQQALTTKFVYADTTSAQPPESSFALAIAGAYLDFYPNPNSGLHGGGTLGATRLTTVNTFDDGTGGVVKATSAAVGWGLAAHVGYDFLVIADHFSIGGVFRLSAGSVNPDVSKSSTSYDVDGNPTTTTTSSKIKQTIVAATFMVSLAFN